MNDFIIRQAAEADYDFILHTNEDNVEVLAPMDRAKLASGLCVPEAVKRMNY